ncbi:MAG: hypothetical protein R3C20_01815 [Planctomycetaceae bacterium]
MTLDVRDQSPEEASDFRFLVEGLPKPSEITAAMSPSRSKDYFSITQPDYITEIQRHTVRRIPSSQNDFYPLLGRAVYNTTRQLPPESKSSAVIKSVVVVSAVRQRF